MKVGTFKLASVTIQKYRMHCLSKSVVIFVIQEAGTEGGKTQLHFEEVLKSNIAIYVVCALSYLWHGISLWPEKYCSPHFLDFIPGLELK